MRVRSRLVTVTFLVAMVVTSCSSAKTTSATLPTTPPPRSDQELAARLVTAVPDGFLVQPDNVGDTGPSDLAKAVRDDDTPGAEQALHADGFVRGYQRLWVGPGDAQVIVILYQFANPAGATAYFGRAKAQATDPPVAGAAPFTVTGLPPGQSSAAAGTSGDTSAAFIVFTAGVFTGQVVCNGPALAGLQARATAVAEDQYGRL
ncbi:MAG: hypothetical protein ACR2GF_01630 [Acidimicrobiales bacterium]